MFRPTGEETSSGAGSSGSQRATFLDPDGEPFDRDVVRHPGAVAVVAVTDDGAVVLVRQYRPAVDRWLLEVPAGTLRRRRRAARGDGPARAGRGGRAARPTGWSC